MLILQKTASSSLCQTAFANSKGLNIVHNDYFLFKSLSSQSHDLEQSKIIIDMFGKFKQTLKILDLKIVSFVFGFNSNINKYIYFYEVRSKKYNTPDLRIDGVVADSNFPFVFFPQMFASLMISILNNVPHNLLVEVSEGR